MRVYLEDTDAGGIVYHASYLRFMERARTDFIRKIGLDAVSAHKDGVLFVVRRALINYFLPAYLGDELEVNARLAAKKKCAVHFIQEVVRIGDEALVCRADVQVVCIDAVRRKPCLLPPQISSITEI